MHFANNAAEPVRRLRGKQLCGFQYTNPSCLYNIECISTVLLLQWKPNTQIQSASYTSVPRQVYYRSQCGLECSGGIWITCETLSALTADFASLTRVRGSSASKPLAIMSFVMCHCVFLHFSDSMFQTVEACSFSLACKIIS